MQCTGGLLGFERAIPSIDSAKNSSFAFRAASEDPQSLWPVYRCAKYLYPVSNKQNILLNMPPFYASVKRRGCLHNNRGWVAAAISPLQEWWLLYTKKLQISLVSLGLEEEEMPHFLSASSEEVVFTRTAAGLQLPFRLYTYGDNIITKKHLLNMLPFYASVKRRGCLHNNRGWVAAAILLLQEWGLHYNKKL